MSYPELSFETKISMFEEEDRYQRWYCRLGRAIRRLFLTRARRKTETEEEWRSSQAVTDLQL